MTPRFVAVLGPTATGKSSLGLAIARRYGGEIVNCDSTAVYRGFDIGTDKVPPAQQQAAEAALRQAGMHAGHNFAARGKSCANRSFEYST